MSTSNNNRFTSNQNQDQNQEQSNTTPQYEFVEDYLTVPLDLPLEDALTLAEAVESVVEAATIDPRQTLVYARRLVQLQHQLVLSRGYCAASTTTRPNYRPISRNGRLSIARAPTISNITVRSQNLDFFVVTLAIKREPSPEIVPQWFVFLTDVLHPDPLYVESRSYTVRPAGRMRWEREINNDDTLLNDMRFYQYVDLGRLPKRQFGEFGNLFNALELGPNNFFIARLFAALMERGLAKESTVTGMTTKALYSDAEFRGNGTDADPDGYLPVDQALLDRYGEQWVRLPEYRTGTLF
ncbi:hypothetical protein BDV10DRAFT_184565 [Aspergillus recurvatus]